VGFIPPNVDEPRALACFVQQVGRANRLIEDLSELRDLVGRDAEPICERVDEELVVWQVLAAIEVVDRRQVGRGE